MLHDGCTSGSIHQASEIFNGPGRGLQCVTNAVCALLHSAKTDPATWRVYDIDEILHKGYMLYQQIGKTDRLLPSDIPEYITIDKTNYEVNEMQSYIGSFSGCNHDFNVVTIDMLSDVFEEYGHFLFCIGKSASAIFREHNTYYIYDPHSRNKHGFPDADGTSVRLKFNSIEKMYNYVANLAIEVNTYEFELTPLLIVMNVPDDYMNLHIKKKRIDFENSEHSHLQYGKPYHVQVFSHIDDIRRQKNREYMRWYRAQKKQNVNNKQHQTQHITDPVKSTSLTRKTEAKRLKHLHVTLQQDKITEEISLDAPVSTRNEKKLKNKQHYMRNYQARQLIQTTPQNQQNTTCKEIT